MFQRVKLTAVNHYNMVMYFDTCWYFKTVSCIDFDIYLATYLSRISKAFVLMMELAGSSERLRDDVRDCTVSTWKSRIQTVQQTYFRFTYWWVSRWWWLWYLVGGQQYILICNSGNQGLKHWAGWYRVDPTKKTVELIWRRYILQLLFAFLHGSCKEVKMVLHVFNQEVDCVQCVIVIYYWSVMIQDDEQLG